MRVKYVALTGVLELSKQSCVPPIDCTCRAKEMSCEHIHGWATTKTGSTSLHNLLSTLWHLNGKDVTVTIEFARGES